MKSKASLIIAAAAACLLLNAADALAWGPVTHVRLAGDVLSNLALLPAALAALLARHRAAYLYGTVAADVVFAKRMSRVKQFCHHWSTGFSLLHRAEDDRGRAFAYGYLSHLAADTVAHGKFVPYHVVLHGTTLNFGHLYWEMRADAAVGEASRLNLQDCLAESHDAHHRALAAALTGTLLPYSMNRAVFERINRLATRPAYHQSLRLWAHCSRWELPATVLDGYYTECVDRTLAVLREGQRSRLLSEDPSGIAALAFAAAHRKDSRIRRRRGLSVTQRAREGAAGHAPGTPAP